MALGHGAPNARLQAYSRAAGSPVLAPVPGALSLNRVAACTIVVAMHRRRSFPACCELNLLTARFVRNKGLHCCTAALLFEPALSGSKAGRRRNGGVGEKIQHPQEHLVGVVD